MVYVERSGKIAVGDKFQGVKGDIPVIFDVDWSSNPRHCLSQYVDSMLVCGTDIGTSIYKLVPGNEKQCRWTRSGREWFYKMYATREGRVNVVKFHPSDGRILLTGSEAGILTLLAYDSNKMNFLVMDTCELAGSITSIAWRPDGSCFVAGVKPTSEISLFGLDLTEDAKALKLVSHGIATCPSSPANSKILCVFGPKNRTLYSCSDEAESITVWALDNSRWRALSRIKCGKGIISLSMLNEGRAGFLVALHKNDCLKFWMMTKDNSSNNPTLKYGESVSLGHYNLQCSWGAESRSCATAIETSRAFIISAGVNEPPTISTLVVQTPLEGNSSSEPFETPWLVEDSCAKESFPYAAIKINSLKLNPDEEQVDFSFVMGGDEGFLHLFSITHHPPPLPPMKFEDESYYYKGDEKTGRRSKELELLLPTDTEHEPAGHGDSLLARKDFSNIIPDLLQAIEAGAFVPLQEAAVICAAGLGNDDVAVGDIDVGAVGAIDLDDEDDDEDDDDADYVMEEEYPTDDGDDDDVELDPEKRTIYPTWQQQFAAAKAAKTDRKLHAEAKVDNLFIKLKSKLDAAVEAAKLEIGAMEDRLKVELSQDDPLEALCESVCEKLAKVKVKVADADVEARRKQEGLTVTKAEHVRLITEISEITAAEGEKRAVPGGTRRRRKKGGGK